MDKIPHATKESEAFLRSVLPDGKEVSLRSMFGNLAAFVGGNMFAGLYGEDLFVRLSEADGAELLKNTGAAFFEPMKGRRMKGYVVVPRAWKQEPTKVKPWLARSLGWTSKLPAKKPNKR